MEVSWFLFPKIVSESACERYMKKLKYVFFFLKLFLKVFLGICQYCIYVKLTHKTAHRQIIHKEKKKTLIQVITPKSKSCAVVVMGNCFCDLLL